MYPFVRSSLHVLSIVHLSNDPSGRSPIHPSTHPPVQPFVHSSIHPPSQLSLHSFFPAPVRPPICPFATDPTIHQSICPFASICLSISVSLCVPLYSARPSIKYVTLLLANFYLPLPLSHIPGPPKCTSHIRDLPIFSWPSTTTLFQPPSSNSLSIVRGG